eukprot:CAMPEP_0175371750 /NCGR_PEP_ID=MMETSP0095-20121207/21877_1 /TAXON_ID=311494 /ORGANISM="Alexandrium monilatum, Strain CCMP3105" /LENGTH=317 /DNA_ID=CAMNT_0016669925 /DNA_START=54 /DNA_END=1008 /DNA_ORIENTATION=+
MSSSDSCCEALTGLFHAAVRRTRERSSLNAAPSGSLEPEPKTPAVLLNLHPGVSIHVLRTGDSVGDAADVFSGVGDSTGHCPWPAVLLNLHPGVCGGAGGPLHWPQVMELGCGSAALPSVVASVRGAAAVCATDRSPGNLRAARSVLARNGAPAESCSARRLAWEDGVAQTDALSWDVVLFADVLYVKGMAATLAKTVAALLRPGGTVLGAVAVHRTESVEIFKEMQRHGLSVQEVELPDVVQSSAAEAAERLREANRCNPFGSMGLSGDRNGCKLLRWTRQGQEAGADMAEALEQEVLHAPPVCEEQACQGWQPTE